MISQSLAYESNKKQDTQMDYKSFYHFYEDEKEQDPENPIQINHNDIKSQLLDSLKHDGDFFGLVDENNNTLQVIYDSDEDTYWVEIPVPEKKGSYGIVLFYDELIKLLEILPPLFDPKSFPDFEFGKWKE